MIFAILLTMLTYVLGLIFTHSGPFQMIVYWYKGFWTLKGIGRAVNSRLIF
ncbi:MAG: TIGR00366 family protein [Deltaproteobacteria bacterium]|nr:TIGR00366 family protein [Deltaproteobacteria bacterium]MBW2069344.1 TIGR00366 family protein [Deltaproteobacteria bacterium]